MRYQVEIHQQPVTVWTYEGRVEDVTLRQSTETWTQGGGGYVHAQGGGWINAPQMYSQTTQYREVRVVAPDGARETLNLAGHVNCFAGDTLQFVYACPSAGKAGKMIGVINRTEDKWWGFTNIRQFVDYRLGKLTMMLIGAAIAIVVLTVMTINYAFDVRQFIEAQIATATQAKNDWDDYGRYIYKIHRTVPPKEYAAQFRPKMDLNTSAYEAERNIARQKDRLPFWSELPLWPLGGGGLLSAAIFLIRRGKRSEIDSDVSRALSVEVAKIAAFRINTEIFDGKSPHAIEHAA